MDTKEHLKTFASQLLDCCVHGKIDLTSTNDPQPNEARDEYTMDMVLDLEGRRDTGGMKTRTTGRVTFHVVITASYQEQEG